MQRENNGSHTQVIHAMVVALRLLPSISINSIASINTGIGTSKGLRLLLQQ